MAIAKFRYRLAPELRSSIAPALRGLDIEVVRLSSSPNRLTRLQLPIDGLLCRWIRRAVISFPNVHPMRLSRRVKQFDSDDWLFELKHNGFRGPRLRRKTVRADSCLATGISSGDSAICAPASPGVCEQTTRSSMARWCLDSTGRSVFNALMFRREMDCYFYAFDILFAEGKDLRGLPLIERKQRLR